MTNTAKDQFEQRVIGIIPKNATNEQRILVKSLRVHGKPGFQPFIGIREVWYKDGPMEEPLYTKRGIEVHRDEIPNVIVTLLTEMSPKEITVNVHEQLYAQIKRLGSSDPKKVVLDMLRNMSKEDVEDIISKIHEEP